MPISDLNPPRSPGALRRHRRGSVIAAVSLVVTSALSMVAQTSTQTGIPQVGDAEPSTQAASRSRAIVALLASSIRTRIGVEDPTRAFAKKWEKWAATLPPVDLEVPMPPPSARVEATPDPTEEPITAGSPGETSPGADQGQSTAPSPSGNVGVAVFGPPTSGSGIVITSAEIAALPTSGAAWDALKRAADSNAGSPNLADRDSNTDVYVLAKALVYARTGTVSYRNDVIAALHAVMGTEAGAIHLAVGRGLAAYVISADLIGLRSADPGFDATFRGWLSGLLDLQLVDGSLTDTHERRPNNHGLHAGASRAAVAAYLGDTAELARVATVFRGWTGERAAYAGFNWGDLAWQANPAAPVGINPPGATLDGHSVDGTLPDEQRRTGGFTWPPPCGSYPHEAVDGSLLTAEILQRAGYPAYQWGSNALLRAEQWLWNTGCPPSGDNVWNLPLLDARYGSNFWNGAVVRPGKNFGWTDWLYGS